MSCVLDRYCLPLNESLLRVLITGGSSLSSNIVLTLVHSWPRLAWDIKATLTMQADSSIEGVSFIV
jgi:hypothetical protein